MKNWIETSPISSVTSHPNERREFYAGVGWYAFWIPTIVIAAGIAYLGLRDNQWKRNFLPGGVFASMALIFLLNFLSRAPRCPWYLGPSLVVDNSGLKTRKWSISWGEIEKISTFKIGKGFAIGIVKKGQKSWEMPYMVDGPLGAKMNDVVGYLQARHACCVKNQ